MADDEIRSVASSEVSYGSVQSVEDNRILIQDVCNAKFRKWNRSKIMLVGEGNAGKTALANSILGKEFDESITSTIGISNLTCSLKHAEAREGKWDPYTPPDKQLEHAIALSLNERSISNRDKVTYDTDSTVAAPKIDIVDQNYVQTLLASNINISVDLIISLYDFGGQEVFNVIHHLFLTPYGVYIVVFNMCWLTGSATETSKEACMAQLKRWVNSVIMHTSGISDSSDINQPVRSAAPIVFVGTHKDVVNDRQSMEEISDKITTMFGSLRLCWDSVIQNTEEDLCFFPVDNRKGKHYEIFPDMLKKIDTVLHTLDYVTQEKPLIWLQALDKLKADKTKIFYTITETHLILASCGIEKSSYSEVLSFFNKMGELLWIDESGLRDIIILNPIDFFVTPATRVICKHKESMERGRTYRHENVIINSCREFFPKCWEKMLSTGIVMEELLVSLLRDNHEIIIHLMQKFGLLVEVKKKNEQAAAVYIVPSLLPNDKRPAANATFPSFLHISNQIQNCFLFSFGFPQNIRNLRSTVGVFNKAQLQSVFFMPPGLYFRYLVKLLYCSQLTTIDIDILSNDQYCNNITITFGNRQFTLRLLEDINSICVTVFNCQNYAALLNKLIGIMEKVINECFGSVISIVSFPWDVDMNNWYVIPYDSVKKAHETGANVKLPHNFHLSSSFISRQYFKWLEINNSSEPCDVFLSYRRGKNDLDFLSRIYNALLDCDYKYVFHDDTAIIIGENLYVKIVSAIINCKVFVPFCSLDAIDKMRTHNPEEVDNVLLEWILALECQKHGMLSILPITYNSIIEKKFAKFERSEIRKIVPVHPTATLKLAKDWLETHGITTLHSSFFRETTCVSKIVEEILVSKYDFRVIEHSNIEECVTHCTVSIQKVYERQIRNLSPTNQDQNKLAMAMVMANERQRELQRHKTVLAEKQQEIEIYARQDYLRKIEAEIENKRNKDMEAHRQKERLRHQEELEENLWQQEDLGDFAEYGVEDDDFNEQIRIAIALSRQDLLENKTKKSLA